MNLNWRLSFSAAPSIPWREDPDGVLHRLFWNEKPIDSPEGIWRVLGVVHLYTSSGIHVYALLDFLDRVIGWTWVRQAHTSRWIPGVKKTILAFGLLLVFWGWYLQDFRPGFARPLVIFILRRWARDQSVRFRLFAPLLMTFALESLFDFGFGKVHYYLAIAGGLAGVEVLNQKNREPGVCKTHLAMSIGSWLTTAVVDLVEYHRISWMTPIYSLLTIPVLAGFLYPMTLLSLFFEGRIVDPLLQCWVWGMELLRWIAGWAPSPLSVDPIALVWGAIFATLYLGLKRKTALAGILVGLALTLRTLSGSPQRIIQLDVKQGDSLLVQKNVAGKQVNEFVDVGPQFGVRTAHWLERLMYYGVRRIDTVLLTHLDQDHRGGLAFLNRLVKIDCVQTEPGDCFASGQVKWFWSQGRSKPRRSNGNQRMAGVLIPLSEGRVYLGVGDADHSQESQFLDSFWSEIKKYDYRIWKVSHHGSRTSSHELVFQRLRPDRVWLSVGKRNTYRHPHFEVLEALRAQGQIVKLERTDQSGDRVENISQPSELSTRLKCFLKKSNSTGC